MSMYRFSGTLKEIVSSASNKTLNFIPDQECSVVVKSGKDETKFVAFLPGDATGILSKRDDGIVFTYDEKVNICVGISKQEWLPTWKVKGHYMIVIETDKRLPKKGKTATAPNSEMTENSDAISVTIESAGKCHKQFHLVSVV